MPFTARGKVLCWRFCIGGGTASNYCPQILIATGLLAQILIATGLLPQILIATGLLPQILIACDTKIMTQTTQIHQQQKLI